MENENTDDEWIGADEGAALRLVIISGKLADTKFALKVLLITWVFTHPIAFAIGANFF